MNNELRAIIVDDELHGRENLSKIIEIYCREIKIVGLADSVVCAKELVGKTNPDVVFLDIEMPVLNGFDFLDECKDQKFSIVLVSAHEEYGIKAVKAGAADYLLKPINIKELRGTIKKLFAIHNRSAVDSVVAGSEKVLLPASHGFNVTSVDEIIRLEAEGCYTRVVFKDGKNVIISRTLKDFEETMPKGKFFRIHKSHLINMNYIREYSKLSGSFIIMSDGSKVEISRRKTPEFIQKIKTVLNTL